VAFSISGKKLSPHHTKRKTETMEILQKKNELFTLDINSRSIQTVKQ